MKRKVWKKASSLQSPKFNLLEEGNALLIDFQKMAQASTCGQDLVPVVAQNFHTKDVLIIAYANRQALVYTLIEKKACFWSTSRNELWVKGATSGDELELVEVRVNCEQNALLYLVTPKGKGACHTQNSQGQSRSTCFYRKIDETQLTHLHL